MKKRLISAAAVLLVCLTVLSACCSYNYDLTKYVTLGQYEGISVSTEKIEEELQSAIDTLISNNTTTNTVTDRAVKDGDTVTIDYAGTKDGVAFEGGTASDQQLVIGSDSYIKGFESGLIGHNSGETVTLNLKFPEDYNNSELAGAAVVFEVTIKSITEKIVPEFNDALVASATDFQTVDEYKADKRSIIKNNIAWETAASNATILQYPKKEVKKYYDNMIASYQSYATAYGVSLDNIISAFTGNTDMESFAASMIATSKNYVRNDLVARLICKEQNISLTDADYERIATQYASDNGYADLKAFENASDKEAIRNNVLVQLAVEYVGAHAVEAAAE